MEAGSIYSAFGESQRARESADFSHKDRQSILHRFKARYEGRMEEEYSLQE